MSNEALRHEGGHKRTCIMEPFAPTEFEGEGEAIRRVCGSAGPALAPAGHGPIALLEERNKEQKDGLIARTAGGAATNGERIGGQKRNRDERIICIPR